MFSRLVGTSVIVLLAAALVALCARGIAVARDSARLAQQVAAKVEAVEDRMNQAVPGAPDMPVFTINSVAGPAKSTWSQGPSFTAYPRSLLAEPD